MRKTVIPGASIAPEGMHVLYADRSEPRVVYMHDVPYCTRDGQTLTMQMLFPRPPRGTFMGPGSVNTQPMPLIVYVQGSAWGKQNCYTGLPNLVDLARAGFVVASVEYRSSDVAPWPAFLMDVKAAIRYLKANAEKFDIDKERVGIWGDSSGGHTALMVGSTWWTKEFDDDICPEESSDVNAVVSFYGLSDIARINDAPRNPIFVDRPPEEIPENILFRGNCAEHPEITAPGNPINYIHEDKDYPPFLLFHGDEDGMVPFLQSALMYEKLRACRKNVEFYKVKGADHGTYLWTPEVIGLVVKFFKAYV